MKSIAYLVAALLAASMPHFANAQTIESKLEQAGKMRYVKVAGLKQAFRDGRMILQLDLFNDDTAQQVVHWRVRWLDDAGMQAWDDEPWKQETVYGKQHRIFQAVSPTLRATDFRIELQSPENDGSGSASPFPSGS